MLSFELTLNMSVSIISVYPTRNRAWIMNINSLPARRVRIWRARINTSMYIITMSISTISNLILHRRLHIRIQRVLGGTLIKRRIRILIKMNSSRLLHQTAPHSVYSLHIKRYTHLIMCHRNIITLISKMRHNTTWSVRRLLTCSGILSDTCN